MGGTPHPYGEIIFSQRPQDYTVEKVLLADLRLPTFVFKF